MNVNARHRGQNSLLYNYVNNVCDLVLVTNARYIKKLQHLKEWFVVYEAKLIQCIHKVYHQQKMRIKIDWNLNNRTRACLQNKGILNSVLGFEFQILMKPLKEIPISIILDIVNKKKCSKIPGPSCVFVSLNDFRLFIFTLAFILGRSLVISEIW